MTYQSAIDDLRLKLQKGEDSDDFPVSREQMLLWLKNNADLIAKEYLDPLIIAGKPVDSVFLQRQACELTEEEIEDCETRNFIELTYKPMGLSEDMGVQKVTTNDGILVDRVRHNFIDILRDLRYAKPSKKHLVWYREGKKIFLEGFENAPNTKFIITYIPTTDSLNPSETSDIRLPDELIQVLMERVEEIALREMQMTIDNQNDGV